MRDDWVAYLDSLAAFGMRPGLERVTALLADLGHPEKAFRAIHVVGTNGKSSTTRYAAAILTAHGRRAGAYLSPHIRGYPERVLVDGVPIHDAAFAAAVREVRRRVGGLPAGLGETTQFEVLTVAAFLALARVGAQAAAVEAGLGGRLDATNVLDAPVVILTNIGLEHTEVLGQTRELIFAEKAAVIGGGDAVFGDLDGLECLAVIRCAEVGARPRFLGRDVTVSGGPADFAVSVWEDERAAVYTGLSVPTPAAYQLANATLAVAACHCLLGGLDTAAVRRGLAAAAVPGRLQIVRRRPLVVADGAHNPHGAAALAGSLGALHLPRPRVALLAMLGDKDVDGILDAIVPLVDAIVCTRASVPRSLSAPELASRVERVCAGEVGMLPAERPRPSVGPGTPGVGLPAQPLVVDDPVEAYAAALLLAGDHGSVLVTGSLYLLEDLAALLGPPAG